MYKFVCSIEYYPNCRGHEEGYYNSLKFFKTFEDILNYALENIHEYVILDCYGITGSKIGKFSYEIESSGHNCSGIKFSTEKGNHEQMPDLKVRTIDDSKGKLIWEYY